ncbi:MAG: hypothetical protein RSA29_06700 [Clostridium sp.]|uniref:hypothetical protein n=1 Tax=Clostridium sp. TaxID=1506 RepID=UPI003031157B
MRKIRKIILFTIIMAIFSSLTVLASEVITPVTELIDNGREYDSKIVNVKGEAIGELLERGENSFVNINDGTSAMGIYLKTTDGESIEYYGDYHNVGNTVKIIGIFNRACKEHGGDMDIHSEVIQIVSKGHEREHEIDKYKINLIVILTPIVVYGLTKVYRILKKS